MKQILFGAVLAGAFGIQAHAQPFQFDPSHTEVRFYYDHVGLSEQSGEWKVIKGSVEFDPKDIAATKVTVTIAADSVDTGVKALDDHLKSADFFEVDKYPTITFVSTGVKQVGKNRITLTGNLTIRDKSKPISMDFTLNHVGPHPLGKFIEKYQGHWIGVEGGGSLLRSDYGVGKFAPLTGDRVRLKISAELKATGS